MELRKVNDNYTRKYAKNDEITKEELKKFTPKKWLTASAIGLATIFYTSPKDSPLRIGVVFGCVSLNDEENINPANHTVPFITLAVIILGTIFFIY